MIQIENFRPKIVNKYSLSSALSVSLVFNVLQIKQVKFLRLKMSILRTYKLLDDFMDLDAVRRSECWIGFRTAYISVSFLCWFTMSLVDLILNIDDFEKIAQPMIMVTGHSIVITVYCRFIFSRDRFIKLLDDFQSIVDESMSLSILRIRRSIQFHKRKIFSAGIQLKQDRIFYTETESRLTKSTKIGLSIAGSVFYIAFIPYVRLVYQWCVGTYTLDSWMFFYIPSW